MLSRSWVRSVPGASVSALVFRVGGRAGRGDVGLVVESAIAGRFDLSYRVTCMAI